MSRTFKVVSSNCCPLAGRRCGGTAAGGGGRRWYPRHLGARGGIGRVFNAPIDVILTPEDVFEPDLVVVTNRSQITKRGIDGPPALVVEVLSASTSAYDRTTKSQRYAALGIDHYWIVDEATESV